MNKAIIIQARTGSTRLHNKILLPFYKEKRIIDILIENIQIAVPNTPIIIATSTAPNDKVFTDIAAEAGIRCFRGDEENVLQRFVSAANANNVELLVRVCSDNPFLQANTFPTLLQEAEKNKADYVSYGFSDGTPVIKSHLGLFSEAVTLEALEKASTCTTDKLYLEHVTNYLYTHQDDFDIRLLQLPKQVEERKDLRFTLDTPDDFSLLQEVYKRWFEETDRSLESLIRLVESESKYKNSMKKNIQQNTK